MLALALDDRQISELAVKYKQKIKDTPHFKIYDCSANGFVPEQTEKKESLNTIERFFGVYGVTRSFAQKYGTKEFSDNYGFFCGSVYADSMLDRKTDKAMDISLGIKLPVNPDDYIAVEKIIGLYKNLISRPNINVTEATRGFLQGISNEAEKELKNHKVSLDSISKEEIKIGPILFRGIDYTGKRKAMQASRGEENENVHTIEPTPVSQLRYTLNDIGGNSAAKEAVREILNELLHPEMNAAYGIEPSKGVLIHGPPGTGKSMLAEVIAREVNRPFYNIRVKDILSKWVGESEGNLERVLENKNSVIFFDEMDSLGADKSKADGSGGVSSRLVNIIATAMDGLGSEESNIYIGAVNHIRSLDNKLTRPGRFNLAVYLGVPNEADLRDILERRLSYVKNRSVTFKRQHIDLYQNIDTGVLAKIMYIRGQDLKNNLGRVPIVGADVKEIVTLAAKRGRDFKNMTTRKIITQDFIEVIKNYTKPSLWEKLYEEEAL